MAFPRYFKPNVDLKLLLQRLRDDCKHTVEITPQHIKGHQNRNQQFEYDEAPQSVRRNIDMDEISREFLKEHKGALEPSPTQLPLPGNKATLVLGSTNVQNNIHHHVNLYFFGHDLEQRLCDKTGLGQKFQSVIQWRAFERAIRGTPEKDKLSTFNVIHDK